MPATFGLVVLCQESATLTSSGRYPASGASGRNRTTVCGVRNRRSTVELRKRDSFRVITTRSKRFPLSGHTFKLLVAVCSVLPPELPFCATPIGVVSQPTRVYSDAHPARPSGTAHLASALRLDVALEPRRAWPYHRPSCVEAKQAAHESSFSRFLHRLRGLCRGWDSNPRPRAFNSNIPSRCKALPTELPRHNAGLFPAVSDVL